MRLWKRFRDRPRLAVTLIILAALAVISFLNGVRPSAQVGTTLAVVSIVHARNSSGQWVENPTNAQIDTAVRDAVALVGGLPANVAAGKKIVIQPNLVEAGWASGSGVVPNSQVVRTVIKMCIERGASPSDITICEGTAAFRYGTGQGGYTDRQMTLKALKDSGLDPDGDMWVEDTDNSHIARCVDANNVGQVYPNYPGYSGPYDSAYVTQVVKSGLLISRAYVLPNVVLQADVLIRIPCLKNHGLAGITGSLKLAFGFGPTDIYHIGGANTHKWSLLHQQSWGYSEQDTNARGMADMTYCRPPDFIVTDALVGVTNGPCGDNGVLYTASPKTGFIMASTDPVAIDTIQALCCGYSYTSIYGLWRGSWLALGQIDPGKIEVRGDHVNGVRRWFPARGCAIPGDANPPTLSNLTISDGAHVCGQLLVGPVNAADPNPGLCKAELYVDSVLTDSNNAATFQVAWTPTAGITGQHGIKYTLYDQMLNETSLTRTVNVHSGDQLVSAMSLPEGTAVSIGPLVSTGAAPAIDSRTLFLSTRDGLRGLRVRFAGTVPTVALGRGLAVYGVLSSVDGQRYLDCSLHSLQEQYLAIKPRLLRNDSLGGAAMNAETPGVANGKGPHNLGCLVKTVGKVSAGGSNYFYIDDGSLGGSAKLKVKCGSFSQPSPGRYVSVVGFSCCENTGGTRTRVLVARSATDITPVD